MPSDNINEIGSGDTANSALDGSSETLAPDTEAASAAVGRVLVVDDDAVTRLLVGRALKDAGYAVVGEAEDGETGVTLARDLNPDLILMDSSLPGMNGIEAIRQIMAERPVAIIMLTGHSEEEHVNQAIDAGACTYLVKPINGTRLIPAIQTAMDIYGTQRSSRRTVTASTSTTTSAYRPATAGNAAA